MNEKILVLDDDVAILGSLEKQLKSQSFIIDFENDPLQALKKIEQKKYDLIISDVMMKPITGIEVLQQIKTTHPRLPVIILTGFVDDQIIDRARELGCDDFLIKPVRKRELINCIKNVLP